MHTKKHCSPFKKRLPYSCLSQKALLDIGKGLNKIKGITRTISRTDQNNYMKKISYILTVTVSVRLKQPYIITTFSDYS